MERGPVLSHMLVAVATVAIVWPIPQQLFVVRLVKVAIFDIRRFVAKMGHGISYPLVF